jgi:hypothetical protein
MIQVGAGYSGLTYPFRGERRGTERFPFAGEVKFRLLSKRLGNKEGTGVMINLSSGGVLLKTPVVLPPGKAVELALTWPARLDGRCALKMLATGRIIRYENGMAAIQFLRHEFRTIGSRGLTL